MEFSDKAAADIAWSEIAPQFNPSNPQHKEVHAAMTRFYTRAFPPDELGDHEIPAQLRDKPPPGAPGANPDNQDGGETEGASVEFKPEAAARVAEILNIAPGPEFDAFKQEANEYINANFKSYDDFY